MRVSRYAARVCVAACAAWLVAGCGKHRGETDYARMYGEIASSAVSIDEKLEPLRCSRLGLVSADSLLFTWSTGEIREVMKRLRRLETQISRFPADRLDPAPAARATVILEWSRGARFAITGVQSYRTNPLLYCAAAEEALRAIPARVAPPYAGEREAYRRRLGRIPALLANARRNLSNPAEMHVRSAVARLDSLETSFPALRASIERRYGAALEPELGAARDAILEFRRFAAETLLPDAHGSIILGLENVSGLLDYGELVNSDPNMLMAEAKKQIKRLETEKAAIAKRLQLEREGILPRRAARASRAGLPIEARVDSALADLARLAAAGGPARPVAEAGLAYPADVPFASPTGRISVGSVLFPGGVAAVAYPLSSRSACKASLALSPRAPTLGVEELRLALLDALPEMSEPRRLRCEAGDTVSYVFSSETFDGGWRYLVVTELSVEMKKSDPELFDLVLDRWIEEYARMIVVFSLHGGSMTSEAAERYLVETARLSPQAAAQGVLDASEAPEIAYPAISKLLIEEMTRNVSYVFGYGNPQEELIKLLRQWRDLPLALVMPKTESD